MAISVALVARIGAAYSGRNKLAGGSKSPYVSSNIKMRLISASGAQCVNVAPMAETHAPSISLAA